MPPIFVDARDLAERLDVRYDTVLGWVRRGKIPRVRDGRGRLLFNLNSVLERLRQKTLEPPRRPPAGRVDNDNETLPRRRCLRSCPL
jgi:excisionase family DNA binding protein